MNIFRSETQQRSRHVTAQSYEVSLDFTGHDDQTFASACDARFRSDGGPTWIDLIADAIVGASIDGRPLDLSGYDGARLPLAPTPGDHVLTIKARFRYSNTGEGLHRMVDPTDGRTYLYTKFRTADARRVYACFEQPDLKATFRLTVLTANDWVVVSNSTNPETIHADGVTTWIFPATPPIPTHVTAVVAGQYYVDHGTVVSRRGELPAALVCRQSMREYLDSDRLRTTTQRGLEHYESVFDVDYPFDSYDQCFVPEYDARGSDNAGCVTISDDYLWRSRVTAAEHSQRDNTLLQELAHMWFGDLVTMRWWNDLWLSEGLAGWASRHCQAQLARNHADPWAGFAADDEAWALEQDQLPTTHPVAADMMNVDAVRLRHDGIIRAKGVAVLKQLVSLAGERDFLRGVHTYLTDHALGNASFTELLEAITAASRRDLTVFTADWLQSCGTNTLTPEVHVDAEGKIRRFAIAQGAPPDQPILRHHHLSVASFALSKGRLQRVYAFDTDIEGNRTPVPQLVGLPHHDLLLVNDGDKTFAKVRFDEASLRSAVLKANLIDDSLARTQVMMILQDMWRDGELASGLFLASVLMSLATETDMTVLRRRLLAGHIAATAYSAPSVRPDNHAQWQAGLYKLLGQAAPGSDPQMAFADAFIDTAGAGQAANTIMGWLMGQGLPDGLTVAADRRWRIIRALARLGRIDASDIQSELARDATQAGLEQSVAALAALPVPDAKAEAWRLATAAPGVSKRTHRQICRSFWQYGQESLAQPYTSRYLSLTRAVSDATGIWAAHGDAMAKTALTELWPATVANEGLVETAVAYVATHPNLRPLVTNTIRECIDRTQRVLRAQSASTVLYSPALGG